MRCINIKLQQTEQSMREARVCLCRAAVLCLCLWISFDVKLMIIRGKCDDIPGETLKQVFNYYTMGLRIPAIWLAKKRGFFFYWPTVCAVQDMYAYNTHTRDSHASSKFTVQSSKFSMHDASSKIFFGMFYWIYKHNTVIMSTNSKKRRRKKEGKKNMNFCLAHAHVTCKFAISMCPVTSYLVIYCPFWDVFTPIVKIKHDTQAYFVDQWEWMHSLTLETV